LLNSSGPIGSPCWAPSSEKTCVC